VAARRDGGATGAVLGVAAAGGVEPLPVGAVEPAGQSGAELATHIVHGGLLDGAGLVEVELVELQAAEVAIPPAADDCLGDHRWVDIQRGPGAVGPGAQLAGEVGQERKLAELPVGMAGDQLVEQAAGRLGDAGVEQRGRGDNQDAAGLGLAGRGWGQQQAEVAVGNPAGLQGLAERVGAELVHLPSRLPNECSWDSRRRVGLRLRPCMGTSSPRGRLAANAARARGPRSARCRPAGRGRSSARR
jgi:hypothetical protein